MTTKRTYTPEQIAVKTERKRQWRKTHPLEAQAERRRYYEEHKQEESVATVAWGKAHPEKIREYRRRYERGRVLTEEQKEKRRAAMRSWHRRHRREENERTKAYRARIPERVRDWNRAWRAKNPQKVRDYSRQRYGRERRTGGRGLTGAQWQALVGAYKGRCAYCGKKRSLTADHVEPLVHGGKHSVENIVPACKSCNSRKHASLTGWEAPKRMMV